MASDDWALKAAPKRFYKAVSCVQGAQGWEVLLDGAPLRTPGKATFAAPEAVAAAAAQEWDAQQERINPLSMPVTRAVNVAIDRISQNRAAVAQEIAGYGASDLLCYRASEPLALAQRQAKEWDGYLNWAEERFGAKFILAQGVMFTQQPAPALEAVRAAVEARCNIGLAALYELTALSGSVVLALAVDEGGAQPQDAWRASRLDEAYQAEQWGEDAEAEAMAARKQADFEQAARLSALLREA